MLKHDMPLPNVGASPLGRVPVFNQDNLTPGTGDATTQSFRGPKGIGGAPGYHPSAKDSSRGF